MCTNTDKLNTEYGQNALSVSVSIFNIKYKWAFIARAPEVRRTLLLPFFFRAQASKMHRSLLFLLDFFFPFFSSLTIFKVTPIGENPTHTISASNRYSGTEVLWPAYSFMYTQQILVIMWVTPRQTNLSIVKMLLILNSKEIFGIL